MGRYKAIKKTWPISDEEANVRLQRQEDIETIPNWVINKLLVDKKALLKKRRDMKKNNNIQRIACSEFWKGVRKKIAEDRKH